MTPRASDGRSRREAFAPTCRSATWARSLPKGLAKLPDRTWSRFPLALGRVVCNPKKGNTTARKEPAPPAWSRGSYSGCQGLMHSSASSCLLIRNASQETVGIPDVTIQSIRTWPTSPLIRAVRMALRSSSLQPTPFLSSRPQSCA